MVKHWTSIILLKIYSNFCILYAISSFFIIFRNLLLIILNSTSCLLVCQKCSIYSSECSVIFTYIPLLIFRKRLHTGWPLCATQYIAVTEHQPVRPFAPVPVLFGRTRESIFPLRLFSLLHARVSNSPSYFPLRYGTMHFWCHSANWLHRSIWRKSKNLPHPTHTHTQRREFHPFHPLVCDIYEPPPLLSFPSC